MLHRIVLEHFETFRAQVASILRGLNASDHALEITGDGDVTWTTGGWIRR